MATTHDLRPAKRRRTKKNDPMREDDVEAQDAVTVERVTMQTRRGPVEAKKFVPIPPATIATTSMNIEESSMPNIYSDSNDFDDNPYYDDSNLLIDETAAAAGYKKVIIFIRLIVYMNNTNITEANLPKGVCSTPQSIIASLFGKGGSAGGDVFQL